MKKYMSFKLVEAEPCVKLENGVIVNADELNKLTKGDLKLMSEVAKRNERGYKINNPDGYKSFYSEETFERTHMRVDDAITITQNNVEGFIKDIDVITMGKKTTVVRAVLKNGFEIVESSSCVDEKNYDQEYGAEICMKKIKDQIWKLLGFLLQTAKNGIDKKTYR